MKKVFACQTPGCSAACAAAWSCHNRRVGTFSAPWAAIGLLLLVAVGAVF